MVKKMFLILVLCFFMLTGCGKKALLSEKEVDNYLRTKYPEEKFQIITVNEIELGDAGGCDDGGVGNSWKIKSMNTNIEFTLEDEYYFNSFTCEYGINDNYFKVSSEKFISENNDARMKSYYACSNCMGLAFERENFISSDEMFNFIQEIILKLNDTYPFKYNEFRNNIYFSIDNSMDTNKPFTLEEVSTEKKLREIIEQL